MRNITNIQALLWAASAIIVFSRFGYEAYSNQNWIVSGIIPLLLLICFFAAKIC